MSETSDWRLNNMIRDMTCIVCPIGCSLSVELSDSGEVLSVSGNTCPRGYNYAVDECTFPKRTVTTTVRCADGRLLPVKTKEPIPKGEMFNLINKLADVRISLPINIGDVIIKDVYGTDVVATKSME